MKKLLLLLVLAGCCSERAAIEKIKTLEIKEIVTVRDTVITPRYATDTLLMPLVLWETDTAFIEKEKLRIQVIREKGDEIRIMGECVPDTIITEKQVLQLAQPDKDNDELKIWLMIAALGALAGFLARRFV